MTTERAAGLIEAGLFAVRDDRLAVKAELHRIAPECDEFLARAYAATPNRGGSALLAAPVAVAKRAPCVHGNPCRESMCVEYGRWDATPAAEVDVESDEQLIRDGIEAFRLTREYVDPTGELLPAIEGWSWFDWCEKAAARLSEPVPPEDPT